MARPIDHPSLRLLWAQVDWAHAGLGITNVAAALGVLYVTYLSAREPKRPVDAAIR